LIIDTTYLLPLTRIQVDTDLLTAIAEGETDLKLEDIAVNLISIFELQAKAAKLGVPSKFVAESVDAILSAFRVVPFHKPEVIETSFELRKNIQDYIDCVIVATAATLKETLITEDALILTNRKQINEKYGISILSYEDFIRIT